MSDDPDNVYHFCEEDRPVRFSNICKPNKKWSDERCNAEGHCLRSYVFGDPGKFRGDTATCRTVPSDYLDDTQLKYGKKVCKANAGLCFTCADDQDCHWSYLVEDDPKGWKGPSAFCRCEV